ncbi:aldehyde dehydrogenase [Tothia fuscella]|uniref:Aldehyde dehydrogenase n=1 Tax=Tothia fuscella TaxID=1048955 RepID=A0A9P4U3U6_9PEZI|nr:aldehyde dehydrogenase [Tothia fuscella]
MTAASTLASTPTENIAKIVGDVGAAFRTGKTLPIEWRKEQLRQVFRMLDVHEKDFQESLFLDMGKIKLEAQLFEMGMLKNDIIHMLTELDNWLAPEAVSVPEPYQHWSPTVHKQPKGTCLIISPWNFPITLTVLPLIANIASGNTVIMKPSELAPHTAAKLTELLPKYVDPECFQFVNGDKDQVTELLKHPYGHIIYTGNGQIGSIVMAAAAKHLTPVTLELGGKSPAIVSDKANLALAAKRITWGKFFNAGQVCMCPDYALVQEDMLPKFLEELKKTFADTYGDDASGKISRIINNRHWNRLDTLLANSKGKIFFGGNRSESELYIEPTVITDICLGDSLLSDEIFGPILPILTYKTLPEAVQIIAKISEEPLGLYIFTEDTAESDFIRKNTRSGGMAINDAMGHVAVPSLAFGGIGGSGMGTYRGRAGVDTFSHRKSVATVPTTEEFEGLLEWRYAVPSGDREEKYRFMKDNLEGKLTV